MTSVPINLTVAALNAVTPNAQGDPHADPNMFLPQDSAYHAPAIPGPKPDATATDPTTTADSTAAADSAQFVVPENDRLISYDPWFFAGGLAGILGKSFHHTHHFDPKITNSDEATVLNFNEMFGSSVGSDVNYRVISAERGLQNISDFIKATYTPTDSVEWSLGKHIDSALIPAVQAEHTDKASRDRLNAALAGNSTLDVMGDSLFTTQWDVKPGHYMFIPVTSGVDGKGKGANSVPFLLNFDCDYDVDNMRKKVLDGNGERLATLKFPQDSIIVPPMPPMLPVSTNDSKQTNGKPPAGAGPNPDDSTGTGKNSSNVVYKTDTLRTPMDVSLAYMHMGEMNGGRIGFDMPVSSSSPFSLGGGVSVMGGGEPDVAEEYRGETNPITGSYNWGRKEDADPLRVGAFVQAKYANGPFGFGLMGGIDLGRLSYTSTTHEGKTTANGTTKSYDSHPISSKETNAIIFGGLERDLGKGWKAFATGGKGFGKRGGLNVSAGFSRGFGGKGKKK